MYQGEPRQWQSLSGRDIFNFFRSPILSSPENKLRQNQLTFCNIQPLHVLFSSFPVVAIRSHRSFCRCPVTYHGAPLPHKTLPHDPRACFDQQVMTHPRISRVQWVFSEMCLAFSVCRNSFITKEIFYNLHGSHYPIPAGWTNIRSGTNNGGMSGEMGDQPDLQTNGLS